MSCDPFMRKLEGAYLDFYTSGSISVLLILLNRPCIFLVFTLDLSKKCYVIFLSIRFELVIVFLLLMTILYVSSLLTCFGFQLFFLMIDMNILVYV